MADVAGDHSVFASEIGDPHEEGYFGGWFVKCAFFPHALVTGHFAVVRAEYNGGVVGVTRFFKGVHQFAQLPDLPG